MGKETVVRRRARVKRRAPDHPLSKAMTKGRKLGRKKGRKRRRRGIFSLDYENASEEEERSRFEPETKTIWI